MKHLYLLLLGLSVYSQNLQINSGGSITVLDGAKVTLEDVTVATGGSITASENAEITLVNVTVNENGSFTLKNASLTVAGEHNGDGKITYTKTLDNSWTSISSPVQGQSVKVFADQTNLESGLGGGINNRGLVSYNNATSKWDIYQQGSEDWGNFVPGKAYLIKLGDPNGGDISFKGDVPDNSVEFDSQNHNVIYEGETVENTLHFVGNPFPSYVDVNKNVAGNSLMKVNEGKMNAITLYFWDNGTWGYKETNYNTASKIIGPTEGFFVRVKKGEKFTFPKNLMNHQQKPDNASKKNTNGNIRLTLTDNTTGRYKYTDIFYTETATTGNDPGYDSTIFYNGQNYFGVYSHLVSDSEGDDYGVQSLPKRGYEKMIIPIGVNATAGTKITLSATITNLPSELDTYLEDKETNTFTLMDENSTFTTTLSSDLNGIGRFYLYTTGQALELTDVPVNNNNISMYTSSRDNLRVVGVQNEQAMIRIYNLLGKKILDTHFKGNGLNNVALPINLPSGVYVVQLMTSTGKLNKKIILE